MDEILSRNGIKYIDNLDKTNNKIFSVCLSLQILTIDRKDNAVKVTISDGEHLLHDCFVMNNSKEKIMRELKIFDIVKISSILPYKNIKMKIAQIVSTNYNYRIGSPKNVINEDENLNKEVEGRIFNVCNVNNDKNVTLRKMSKVSLNLANSLRESNNQNNFSIAKEIDSNINKKSDSPYTFEIFNSHRQSKSKEKNKENTKEKNINNSSNVTTLRISLNNQSNNKQISGIIPHVPFRIPQSIQKLTPTLKNLSSLSHNFNIIVKVIYIRTGYSNFSFIIKDKESIKAELKPHSPIFNSVLKFNKTFSISNGNVEEIFENKFGYLINYRITTDIFTKIEEMPDDDSIQSEMKFINLTQIKENYINNNFYCGVLVKIYKISEQENNNENNRTLGKFYSKILTVFDKSFLLIDVLISQNIFEANSNKIRVGEVVYITSLLINYRKSEYYLTSSNSTSIEIVDNNNNNNNNTGEISEINQNLQNHKEKYNDHIGIKTSYIKEVNLNNNKFSQKFINISREEEKKFVIKGYIVNLEHSKYNVYAGCKYCKKKFENEKFPPQCTYCKKYTIESCYYYRFYLSVRDCTDGMKFTLFAETAEQLLGMTAEEYLKLVVENEPGSKQKLRKLENDLEFSQFYFIISFSNKKRGNEFCSFTLLNFHKVELEKEMKNLIARLKFKI